MSLLKTFYGWLKRRRCNHNIVFVKTVNVGGVNKNLYRCRRCGAEFWE